MEYGCIGERLGHSFSREIHKKIGQYKYELCEVSREAFDDFMTKRDFKAINVTIPYKQSVIPYLYEISDTAQKIGAVNTIINKDGKLYGYNTDYCGMRELIEKNGVSLNNKKVLICGTGGTSKTAFVVAESLGAREIYKLSRSGKGGALTYSEAEEMHNDAKIIINTTPCGMFPNENEVSINLDRFNNLEGVFDAIYNPIRTKLVINAKEKGVTAQGGLYMLAAQAVTASEFFFGKKYSEEVTDRIYKEILQNKENIVLIGMPASGKTTVGKILAERLGRQMIDTDEEIVKIADCDIPTIFDKYGEKKFRELEARVIEEIVMQKNGYIIATGGGAVLNMENVRELKQNGRLYFLDRDIKNLVPTADRPLADSFEAIKKRFDERYEIYKKVADCSVDAEFSPEKVSEFIERDYGERL